jgi:hypothetical protein
MNEKVAYHGRVAIASAGMTPLTRKSGEPVLSLATEACCRLSTPAASIAARSMAS